MKLWFASLLLLAQTSMVVAQTQSEGKPSAGEQTPAPPNTDAQIAVMSKQLDALNQLILQNQRGLIVYPTTFALPGPINCGDNCLETVSRICGTLRYPKSYVYPALVTSAVIGTFVNGVCYGP